MLKTISRTLLYLPLLWLAIGIIWLPQGNKPMVAIVVPVALLYVLTHGFEDVRRNFKDNYWLSGLLLSSIFVGASYFIHGASSQELRGLLISLVYLALLPIGFITINRAQTITFLASLSSFSLSIWYFIIEPSDRMLWPTNPIPLAIHQGMIYLLSLALLLTDFDKKKKWLLVLSMLLSGFSILPTESRGPIILVAMLSLLSLVISIYKKRIRAKHTLLIFLAVFLVLFVTKEPILSRIADTSAEVVRIKNGDLNSSMGLRAQMYSSGIELFIQKPFLGHGEISSEYAEKHVPGYSRSAYWYMKGHFHNNYIDKMAKSGVFGLVFFLFFLVYPFYMALKKYKFCFWVLGLPSIYYVLVSLFDSPFRNGDTTVLYLVVVGLTLQVISARSQDNRVGVD
ncbi:O-antigen ligase family protein [Vibrio sp. JPW-9-11-11]|uniref:O-antigen ligase family protein n=1 Tax=Vibrio sp. JPW-9-11-11 TaxID=1416532 RepID=UPI00159335A6|nr:O-antigen ligase family protein [Vibrio sp. JPW-9-11-11]NVD05360.1 O-antigen ligase family protein [Vibrio sp. JPW-9-11-11]